MSVAIVPLTTEEEVYGKAFVHYTSWKEAYQGLLDQDHLDARTFELSEKIALGAYHKGFPTVLAKDGDCVVGFADYGPYRGDDLLNAGEIYAIYLLESHYRQGIGTALMKEVLTRLDAYECVVVWVLKGNERAISFYRHLGFVFDGSEAAVKLGSSATELRMVLDR